MILTELGQCSVAELFRVTRGFMTLMVLSGCVSTGMPVKAESSATARDMQMGQVIVKFKDPLLDPARQTYLQELKRDLGITLVYIRPMAGGAHVFRIDGSGNSGNGMDLSRIAERLAKRVDVEYAEPDRILRPAPQPQK